MNSPVHSERQQAEQLRAGEYRLLELIANRSPLETILTSLTQFIEAQAPGMLCSVLLLDRDGIHLRHGAAPSLPETYVRAIDGSPIGPQAGSCGTAAFRKESVFVADILADPLWVNYRELAVRHGLRACWSVPILSPANQVLGTFAMYYHEPRSPSPAELQLIASAANMATIALEHQRAEDALHENELRYRQLVDLLPVAVYTTDMAGRITLFNRNATQLWGRTPQLEKDQWCGSFRMFRPDGSPLPLEQCPMAEALQTSRSLQGEEIVIERPDGSRAYVAANPRPLHDAAGRLVGAVNVLIDLTKLRRTEHALVESEARFRTAFAGAAVGMALATLEGHFQEVNPALCAFLGYTKEELLQLNFAAITHPEDLPGNRELLRRLVARETPSFVTQKRYVTKAGSIVWAQTSVSRLSDAQGRPLNVVAIIENITERQRALEALQQAKTFSDTVIHTANVMVVGLDVTGAVQIFNEAAQQLTGYTQAEVLGKNWFALMLPKDKTDEVWAEFLRLLQTGMPDTFENPIVTKHGETRLISWQNSRVEAAGRAATLSFGIDITARRAMEEALRRSELQLRLFIDSAPVAIAMFDTQVRYLAASARWLGDYALGERDLRGLSHYEVFPEIPERWKAIHRRALAGETMTADADRFERADGSIQWLRWVVQPWHSAGGEVGGLIMFSEDITRRQQTEEALRNSEARFRELANLVPQIVWIARPDTGDFVYANRNWFERIGLSAEQTYAPGGWQQAVHPDDLERTRQAMHASLQTGQPFELELRVKQKQNGYRWHLNRAVPARDDAGRIVRWIGSATDIENQKHTEELLEQHVAQRTAKLHEAVGELEQFSYSITHDLRAPLRAIQGFATLLERQSAGQLTPAASDHLRHIMTATERMDKLIRDSLNYGKLLLEEIKLLPVDIATLTQGIIRSYPALQPPQAEVTLEGAFPLVLGNESALTQCVSNLLNNAVKFVPPGTLPRVRIHAEPRGQWIRLWFDDNGIGIATEFQDRIFGMYQQLDKSFEGTGIGLAIVRKAVERMGGKAGVESQLGQGSRFWLDLKRAPEDSPC